MAEFSQLFRDDPELLARALGTFDAARAPPPEPVPPEPAPAPAPVDMRIEAPVSAPTGGLRQQRQELVGQSVGAANDTADSFTREGDAKASGASEAAKVYGAQALVADRYARAAETAYRDNQERVAKYRQLEDEDFERLRQEPPRPGWMKDTFNVITGIIGAAAGGEQGAALSMLRQHVNRGAEIDAQERAMAAQRLGQNARIQDSIMRDSANELDASSKLVANQWLVASRQLEQIANESNVPAFREQALRLSIGAKEQARDLLRQNVQQQMAEAAAAQQARMKAMKPDYSGLSDTDLEALQRANLLPAGEYAKLLAIRKNEADLAKGEQGKAERQVPGRQVVDPQAFATARDVDLAKFRDTEAKMRALDATLDKLDRKLAEHGTEAFGDQSAEMEALAASALGTIKDVKTLGTLDNGLLAFGEKLLGDPTSWYKSGGSVRKRIKASRAALREEVEATAEGLGLSRTQEPSVDDQAQAFGARPVGGAPAQPQQPASPVVPGPAVADYGGGRMD